VIAIIKYVAKYFLPITFFVSGVSFVLQAADQSKRVNVLVWDEQQPEQKKAYPNFLGNAIANHLKLNSDLNVKSVKLDDPEQGISAKVLDWSDVIVWWGHVRHDEISVEKSKDIVRRIKQGDLSLIALHSTHWSNPFVEAMNERTRMDFDRDYGELGNGSLEVNYVSPAQRFRAPIRDEKVTPWVDLRKYPTGKVSATVYLPISCFPAYRPDGKPSTIKTLLSEHPIAAGIPPVFVVSNTEMYDEPFHIPQPDAVIFEEMWEPGEWFRSGSLWNIGKGKVFYFRPGHETYKVYFEPLPLKIIENAVIWLNSQLKN
jgi:trehalose utilization protein